MRPSSRTSNYSLQTLPRPSSSIQQHPHDPSPARPPSLIDHAANQPPPGGQHTRDSELSVQHTRDEFLPQDVDRYDRIWGDMAARMGDLDTLVSKPATDMRLVSENHAKSVENLREAQIRLAEAWAGSESRLGTTQSSLLSRLANSAAGVDEAEISNEERSKMNDQVFQQMEQEIGIVMAQLAEVISAQAEVEKVSRDIGKSALSIAPNFEREVESKEGDESL